MWETNVSLYLPQGVTHSCTTESLQPSWQTWSREPLSCTEPTWSLHHVCNSRTRTYHFFRRQFLKMARKPSLPKNLDFWKMKGGGTFIVWQVSSSVSYKDVNWRNHRFLLSEGPSHCPASIGHLDHFFPGLCMCHSWSEGKGTSCPFSFSQVLALCQWQLSQAGG